MQMKILGNEGMLDMAHICYSFMMFEDKKFRFNNSAYWPVDFSLEAA